MLSTLFTVLVALITLVICVVTIILMRTFYLRIKRATIKTYRQDQISKSECRASIQKDAIQATATTLLCLLFITNAALDCTGYDTTLTINLIVYACTLGLFFIVLSLFTTYPFALLALAFSILIGGPHSSWRRRARSTLRH